MIKALTLSTFLQTLWFISDAAVLPDNYPAAISDVGTVHILRKIIIYEYYRKPQQSCWYRKIWRAKRVYQDTWVKDSLGVGMPAVLLTQPKNTTGLCVTALALRWAKGSIGESVAVKSRTWL